MTPEEIPQEVMDLFNTLAGKIHRRHGETVAGLAEILTLYDEIRETSSSGQSAALARQR